MAAVETVTGTATLVPPVPVTVMVHVPGPSGVTTYVAAPAAAAFIALTLAIGPTSGEHVSISVRVAVPFACVTSSMTGAPDANVMASGDATSATLGEGVAVSVGVGDGARVGDAVGVGVEVGPPLGVRVDPPPHAVRPAIAMNEKNTSVLI
jgi:hypothetical protein